jgi:Na+-transporting methylmalonyl-CoA/oxaloacetate decarboxylase gamma subunit
LNTSFFIAKDDADFIKIIFFLVIMAIVGISKLIQKFQENARKNQTREPRPQPQKQPPPTWRAEEDEVRKFLEQMERENQPQPAPPVIQEQPRPVAPSVKKRKVVPPPPVEPSSTFAPAAPPVEASAPRVAVPRVSQVGALALVATKSSAAFTAADLKKELQQRDNIRRAFVFSEILGTPRGLQ